jgi:hypothetical protein
MITAHQLYNYITDHANTYSMKPVRMSKTACTADGKKGGPSAEQHEYALVALWNRLLRRYRVHVSLGGEKYALHCFCLILCFVD